jgi:dCMP deaminase
MSWDKYYHDLCKTVASNSKCLSRKIGAIIVKDKSIISTGYNGPPRGVEHCGTRFMFDEYLKKKLAEKEVDTSQFTEFIRTTCPRRLLDYKSGEGLDICIAGHAERNALINAARNGVSVKGATIYMDCPIPCKECLIEIINAGIEEIVVSSMDFYDETSKYLLGESKIKLRTYKEE